jgi:hypothetical protein
MDTEELEITTASEDAAPDDWSDVDVSDILSEYENPGEDEPAQGGGLDANPQKAEESAKAEKPDATDKSDSPDEDVLDKPFDLKHPTEARTVSYRKEATVLMQKGLDYDHIRQERDAARADMKRLSAYEEFLKELAAPANQSIDDLMDATRAKLLIESEKKNGKTLDASVALDRVKLDREKKALAQEREQAGKAQAEKTRTDQAEEKRKQDFLDFTKEYPDVAAGSVPKEVWDKVAAGETLTSAYARYENKLLRAKVSALEQNTKNKTQTAGSRQTAGTPVHDKWLDGWED